MTFDVLRTRPLQHVTATGTALAVALGPVVVGALLARSVGGDPMASVNALIAGGGQRARISSAQLRSSALRRSGARLRSRATRGAVRPPRGARTAPVRRLARTAPLPRRAGSAARFARQEEALRRLLLGVRLTDQTGRLDEAGRRQELGDVVR
ncbi:MULTISPECIES: hypothetical protein [unclassified Streptomyces]|uniref:hypothetical protein n=1 Tax=unclassified Streptomyces TaxID=2593676 RepID=UPI001E35D9FC|nr:hypothetical protein [Streptomyces sp. CB02980]MCB8901389.1 hypothetical protein [Streptomyces sp. CB02980]